MDFVILFEILIKSNYEYVLRKEKLCHYYRSKG